MTGVTERRTVRAPAERVWDVATDIPGAAETIRGISRVQMLSEGDFGVGTRWRETRTMFGREATEEMWVSAVDPGRSYTAEAESRGTHYVMTFTFTALTPQQTEVVLSFEARPRSAVARALAGVTGVLGRRAVSKALQRDLADLAAAAERG